MYAGTRPLTSAMWAVVSTEVSVLLKTKQIHFKSSFSLYFLFDLLRSPQIFRRAYLERHTTSFMEKRHTQTINTCILESKGEDTITT